MQGIELNALGRQGGAAVLMLHDRPLFLACKRLRTHAVSTILEVRHKESRYG